MTHPGDPTERGATAAGLLVVGIGFAALWLRFNPSAPPPGAEYPSDLLNYFIPHADYVGRRLAAGELPLWNPYLCAGLPELALAQSAVLYPPTWLQAVLPVAIALPLSMLGHCLVGGVFMALFLRAYGLGAAAGGGGGVLYTATCLVGQTFWPPEVAVLVWLPWLLLCIERWLHSGSWWWWAGFAAGVAAQALAGFPQFFAYSLLFVVPYASLRLAGRERALRSGGALAVSALLGVGIAAAQLLPTWELIRDGERAATLAARSVHYLGALAVSSSQALANSIDPTPKLPAFDFGGGGSYLGIATLLFELFASLPVLGAFRTPERLRVLTLVATILVGAIGFDALGRGEAARRAPIALLAAAIVAAGISLAGEAGAAWRAGGAFAAVAAAIAARGSARARRAIQWALLVGLLVDVTTAIGPFGPYRRFPIGWSQSFHRFGHVAHEAETLAALRAEVGWQRVEVQGVLPRAGSGPIAEVARTRCYEVLYPGAWSALMVRIRRELKNEPDSSEALDAFHDVVSVARVARVRPEGELDPKSLLDINERFREIFRTRDQPLAGPPPGHRVDVVRNEDALPRAYLATQVETASRRVAIDRIVAGRLDPRRTVLVERPLELDGAPAPITPARIVSHAPERVEIATDARSEALLVLTDAYYPGWTASVDGTPADVIRANGVFRGVRVPAGRHRVELRFEPRSFRVGAAISVISLSAVVAIPCAVRSRRRGAARATAVADYSR